MQKPGCSYKGTSIFQDSRFTNKEKKRLKEISGVPEFDISIDISKIEMDMVSQWVSKKVTEYLGYEDDIVSNYVVSQLKLAGESGPKPKEMQLFLTGFLEEKAGEFMKELWKLLIEAQNSADGVAQTLLEEKKKEIVAEKERIMGEIRRYEKMTRFLSLYQKPKNQEKDQSHADKKHKGSSGRDKHGSRGDRDSGRHRNSDKGKEKKGFGESDDRPMVQKPNISPPSALPNESSIKEAPSNLPKPQSSNVMPFSSASNNQKEAWKGAETPPSNASSPNYKFNQVSESVANANQTYAPEVGAKFVAGTGRIRGFSNNPLGIPDHLLNAEGTGLKTLTGKLSASKRIIRAYLRSRSKSKKKHHSRRFASSESSSESYDSRVHRRRKNRRHNSRSLSMDKKQKTKERRHGRHEHKEKSKKERNRSDSLEREQSPTKTKKDRSSGKNHRRKRRDSESSSRGSDRSQSLPSSSEGKPQRSGSNSQAKSRSSSSNSLNGSRNIEINESKKTGKIAIRESRKNKKKSRKGKEEQRQHHKRDKSKKHHDREKQKKEPMEIEKSANDAKPKEIPKKREKSISSSSRSVSSSSSSSQN